MSERVEAQAKTSSTPITAPAQPQFQQRSFSAEIKPVVTEQVGEKPDLQTQLDRDTRFGHNFAQVKVYADLPQVIQPKLVIGPPGDKYEQEADQVAARVMAMPNPVSQPSVQRQLSEESKSPLSASILRTAQRQEPQLPIHRKSLLQRAIQSAASHGASSDVETQLSRSKGGGSPLPNQVRSFMEPRFGADFSSVRVHTGGEAVQMNRELGAQAFAHGSDIYFGAGKSPGNNELTAHELTHTIQQTGRVSAKSDINQPKEVNKQTSIQRLPLVQQTGKQVQIDRKQISTFQKRTEKDWYEGDMLHWAREIDNLPNTKNTFVRAAIFNTQNNYPEEYTTIAQRSAYYDVIDALAATGMLPKKIRFFGAASKVTGKNSVGSIEGAIGWSLHSKEAIKILKDVNEILLRSNMKVINKLMNSKGNPTDPKSPDSTDPISAIEFDLKMVQIEQGIVEDYLNKELEKIPDKARAEAIKDINDDLNFKGFWRTLGEYTLADAQPIEWAKKALGIDKLDFMQRTHREAIGKALVLSLHKNTLDEYLKYMQNGIVPSDKLPESYRGSFSMSVSPK